MTHIHSETRRAPQYKTDTELFRALSSDDPERVRRARETWGKALRGRLIDRALGHYDCGEIAQLTRADRRAIADDVTQDVLSRFLLDPDPTKYRPAGSSLHAYLFTCISNQLKDYRRKAQRQACRLDKLKDEGARLHGRVEPAQLPARQPFYQDVALAILAEVRTELEHKYGDKKKFALIRRYLAEEPERRAEAYQPIARELGISHKSVAVDVHRLRRELGANLEQRAADIAALLSGIDPELESALQRLSSLLPGTSWQQLLTTRPGEQRALSDEPGRQPDEREGCDD